MDPFSFSKAACSSKHSTPFTAPVLQTTAVTAGSSQGRRPAWTVEPVQRVVNLSVSSAVVWILNAYVKPFPVLSLSAKFVTSHTLGAGVVAVGRASATDDAKRATSVALIDIF
jgi:hypothetical protein